MGLCASACCRGPSLSSTTRPVYRELTEQDTAVVEICDESLRHVAVATQLSKSILAHFFDKKENLPSKEYTISNDFNAKDFPPHANAYQVFGTSQESLEQVLNQTASEMGHKISTLGTVIFHRNPNFRTANIVCTLIEE